MFIGIEPFLEAFQPWSSWTCPDLTVARFGFGSDSRPLVFFRWSLGRRPPILNKWTCLGWHRFGGSFGVLSSKGDLMGYSPASCPVYHAAHSCLWDWELRRQPESLWLRSTSPAGFGAFALLDGGSLSSGLGDQGLGSKLFKGGYVSDHLEDYYCRY